MCEHVQYFVDFPVIWTHIKPGLQFRRHSPLLGPAPPQGHRDYRIGSNFWKFYLIKTGFTLGERVFLVKVFRLFRLEWIFFGVQSVDTVGTCRASYLLAGPAWL